MIRHVSPNEVDTDISKIYIRANKSCSPCFCCRPNMDVRLAEESTYLGRVREPFTCCDKDAEIYDQNGNLKYRIIGDCCQMGLCCGSSAEKISEIVFKIVQGNQVVGMMKKMSANTMKTKDGSRIRVYFFPKAVPFPIALPMPER